MRFASIGSGSKGNATLVEADDTLVMVDCGFSARETTRRLARLGLAPEQLSAILVTHEHSDHSAGVARLSRQYRIPVYLTYGTAASGRCDGAHELRCFNCDDRFEVGALAVQTVAVPHDALEPCQFRLSWQQRSLGILTDLGSVTPHVVNSYRGCNSLLLEFNHDTRLLAGGTYPPQLKRRVGGDWGHLNNEQAADLLRELDCVAELNHLVVAHISENNNSRACAEAALAAVLESLEGVTWACQSEGFDWLAV
ncbi:MBL fold metallo-hydrolase [Pseudohalioglobus sediminis]|uniref:MBL fold metallo-hydrolase n=1 Tax=Pseudohalioglobus sediminis TaxID=2606449 RepID=A0A5B0X0E2_9GAMM|nr:MBL fold metallo-hydrolase [Pseudohalioglobus sediminis]KAA1192810.1 MBL fold metallo-hydrolase [Pseudohalioglobus sediminis]